MQQEAAHEFASAEDHGLVFGLSLGAIVLPLEGDAVLIHSDQPAVGDGYPVGIAGQISQYSFRAGKRALGIDHPLTLPQWCQPVGKGTGVSQRGMLTEELQLPRPMGLLDCREETSPKQAREDAHRQEEARFAGDPALPVGRQTTAGDDAVHMRVMGQRRAPGVQHQGQADARTQVSRIGSHGTQGLGRDLKQQAVDHRLVGVGNGADRCRQGEDHVVVRDRQQVGLARLEPAPGGAGLALRAVPVAARGVGNLVMGTGRARKHMAAERGAAALRDG